MKGRKVISEHVLIYVGQRLNGDFALYLLLNRFDARQYTFGASSSWGFS